VGGEEKKEPCCFLVSFPLFGVCPPFLEKEDIVFCSSFAPTLNQGIRDFTGAGVARPWGREKKSRE